MDYTKKSLTDLPFGDNVLFFDTIDSTNVYLMNNHQNLADKTVVIAKNQTNGKGRLGKIWTDLPDASLSMSILVKPFHLQYMQTVPLVCGLCVRSALGKLTGTDIGLKWSNDIVSGGKKICGILCESRIIGTEAITVIGLGVNISQPQSFFDRFSLPYGTSMKILSPDKSFQIEEVAATILSEFQKYFPILQKDGFQPLQSEYITHCVNIDKYVTVTTSSGTLSGIAKTIDSNGNMIVESDGKTLQIASGESSVRGVYGYY